MHIYEVFYEDPTGTQQIDNIQCDEYTVDEHGTLTLRVTTPGQPVVGTVASYADTHWKRIKAA